MPGLRSYSDPKKLDGGKSPSARTLGTIRRDMDLKESVFRARRRNEQILSLVYQDGGLVGGSDETANLRENALNLPYRYARWIESQMTSKKMVVKVNRDAGQGQKTGGPGDDQTGMWQGIALARVAYMAGFEREAKALSGEVIPRGTSVLSIGYHEQEITRDQERQVGKDTQSVVPEVLGENDLEAKPGQAHEEISRGLANIASDEGFRTTAGSDAVTKILMRKDSHDVALANQSIEDMPKESTRLIRHRLWMQKLRVGEDVGWSPHVYDTEDAPMWWQRHVWTVAEVKASPLFRDEFKAVVKGYDGRTVSGVASGGEVPSSQSLGSDARQAQTEDVLTEDERMVEWFSVWIRKPDLLSGGIRKILCAEWPDEYCEADDSNPHVNVETGRPLIPGFFPFYDFTPILPPMPVPERTLGVPPMAVGMTQFEQIAELNRLRAESARRHSLRFYDIHPAHKDDKKLLDALHNGRDGHSQQMKEGQRNSQGQLEPSIVPIQFSGNTLEIDRLIDSTKSEWVMVTGMPPAALQGVGTAPTAQQEQIGVAAGERESSALVTYFEKRMGDVMVGLRGLMRGTYDDEDYQALLGQAGAEVMKAWATGTEDDGDTIDVTFGANATAQEAVERKQLMEAITLERAEIDPVTGLPLYDTSHLVEELHRRLDVGPPQPNMSVVAQLQKAVVTLAAQLKALQGGGGAGEPSGGSAPRNGAAPHGGPNRSEGSSPTEGNISAGARRGTVNNDSQSGM